MKLTFDQLENVPPDSDLAKANSWWAQLGKEKVTKILMEWYKVPSLALDPFEIERIWKQESIKEEAKDLLSMCGSDLEYLLSEVKKDHPGSYRADHTLNLVAKFLNRHSKLF